MIRFLIEIRTVGIDKILGADDVYMLDGRNLVGILKSPVEDGDGHALALHADAVQLLAAYHLYLFFAIAVRGAFDAVPGVEFLVIDLFHHLRDRVRRLPHPFSLCHKG